MCLAHLKGVKSTMSSKESHSQISPLDFLLTKESLTMDDIEAFVLSAQREHKAVHPDCLTREQAVKLFADLYGYSRSKEVTSTS